MATTDPEFYFPVLSEAEPEASSAAPPVTDVQDLVRRASAGELEVWSRLYQETYDLVFRHVCCLVGDPVVAEDLVQDAYARAMVSIARYDHRSSFVTWMRGVALNVVRMHWRRKHTFRRVLQEMTDVDELGAPLDDVHLRQQKIRALYGLLDTLPDHLREAFVLRELEGLDVQEAADQLGISANNVAVRSHRARTRIRAGLGRLGWLRGDQ